MATFTRQNVNFDLDYSEYKPIYSKYLTDNPNTGFNNIYWYVLVSEWHTIEPVTIRKDLPQVNINDIPFTAQATGAKVTYFIRNWQTFKSVSIKTVEGSPTINDVVNWSAHLKYDELWPLLGINPLTYDTYYNQTRYGLLSDGNYNKDFNIGEEPETNFTGVEKDQYAAAYFNFSNSYLSRVTETIDNINYNVYQMSPFIGPEIDAALSQIQVNEVLNNFSSPTTGGPPTFSTVSCEFIMPQVKDFTNTELFATNQLFKRRLFSASIANRSSSSEWWEVIIGLKSY